jgi:pilus assembly protein CpaF
MSSGQPIPLNMTGVKSVQWSAIFSMLAYPECSEVEINGPDNVFVKYKGKRMEMGVDIGKRIAWSDIDDFGRSMADVESHMVRYGQDYKDAFCIFEGGLRLQTNDDHKPIRARFHCLKPPVCEFPLVTIAKQSVELATLGSIVKSGSLSPEMAKFIKGLMAKRQTIVFSGGTGAGKTTFLNAISKFIDPTERVCVCEDAPELLFEHLRDTAYLMSYPKQPGKSADDQATLSWVTSQTARMRVDRIIIGETRGPEFSDFLTAANSGFDGSLTTLHANTPRMALDKMFNFTKRAPGNGTTPSTSINKDIANAVDYIIQLGRPRNKYRVLAIEEVTKTVGDDESAKIKTNPIYQYNQNIDGWERTSWPSDDDMREFLQDFIAKEEARRQAEASSRMNDLQQSSTTSSQNHHSSRFFRR